MVTSLELGLLIAGPACLLLAGACAADAVLRRPGWMLSASALGAISLLPVGLYATGMRYRSPPGQTSRPLAPGLDYERHVVADGAVLHMVRIDLARPDLSVVATPPAEGTAVPARTVRAFAEDEQAEVAINTAFFRPFHSTSPFDYYPEPGDPTEPFGFTMTDGVEFGANRYHRGTIYFTPDAASLTPNSDVRWAVSGRTVLVRDGEVRATNGVAVAPRSAIGFDGQRVLFVVVDGRQPGYSVGITLVDLASALVDLGAQWAVEMDGGGSSTLVDGTDDEVRTLNCPIHTRLPCRERPVAAQVGIKRIAL